MRAFGFTTPTERKGRSQLEVRPSTVQERFAGKGGEGGEGVDIFIGGGGDGVRVPLLQPEGGPMRQYADRYRRETGRPTRYFTHLEPDKILEAVREAQRDRGPINIVGHSYGGTAGYNVAARAARESLRVNNLGTLDPVGRLPVRRATTGEVAGSWTNVNAAPRRGNLSDLVAKAGGKPSRVPVGEADSRRRATANHENADAMMRRGGVRRMLDVSRAAPAPRDEDLHDGMPTPAWMRRRSVQKPTFRTWP